MNREEKQRILDKEKERIASLPYKSVFDSAYCCLCFESLTADNVSTVTNEEGKEILQDLCQECVKSGKV